MKTIQIEVKYSEGVRRIKIGDKIEPGEVAEIVLAEGWYQLIDPDKNILGYVNSRHVVTEWVKD